MANPLSKLFMMKRMEATKPGPSPQEAPPSSSSDHDVCIPAETLALAERQVRTLQQARDEALQQQTQAVMLAERRQSEFDDYRKTSEMHVQQLAQASDSAIEVAKLQAEFSTRLDELQWKASTELAAAKAEIAGKDQELQQKREMILQLEERMQRIDDEWTANVENEESLNRQQIKRLNEEWEAKTRSQQEENALLVGEKIGLETKLALLNEMHEHALKDHEAMIKRKLEQLEVNEADIALLQQTRDTVVAKDEVIQQLEQSMALQKEESEASFAALRVEFDEFQRSAASSRQRLSTDLRSAVEESRSLKAQLEQTQAKLSEATALHETAVSDFLNQLRRAESNRDALNTALAERQVALEVVKENWAQAAHNAQYWKDLFENRPYINFTYFANDAYSFAAETTQFTTEALARKAAPVTRKIAPISKQFYNAHVVPSAIKSKELYDVHMKVHVDKALTESVVPFFDAHITPHCKLAKTAAVEFGETTFDSMVTQFEAFCPTALELLTSTDKTMGRKLPPRLLESAKYACSHPEDEVVVFLKGAGLLVALAFHRTILRLIFGIVRLLLRIIWFFSPLRWMLVFFFPTHPPLETATTAAQAASVKQEPNGTPAKNGSNKMKGKNN